MLIIFMLNLKNELEKRNLTNYGLGKQLGLSSGNFDRLSKRVKGELPIKYATLKDICEAISKMSGSPLAIEELGMEMVVVKIK